MYFLSIYYLFISITAEHKVAFFTFCLLLYVRLSTASVLVCLFVSMFFEVFLSKCLAVSVSLIWLFGCYPAPVFIFAKCRYCYFKFSFCNISFIFINHHPSFFISFFHPSIGREFNMLSSSCIIYPYPSVVWVSRVSTNYVVLFVLQRVTFSFCLFFKLSLATTTGVDVRLRLSFDII